MTDSAVKAAHEVALLLLDARDLFLAQSNGSL